MSDLRTAMTAALIARANAGGALLFESGSCWAGNPTPAMPVSCLNGTTTNVTGKCFMVTARHFVFAWHARATFEGGMLCLSNGSSYGIVSCAQPTVGVDIGIGTLDADAAITPIKVLPANWCAYLTNNGLDLPVILAENRNKQAVACQIDGNASIRAATDTAFAGLTELFHAGDSSGGIMGLLAGEYVLFGTLFGIPGSPASYTSTAYYPAIADNLDAIGVSIGSYSLNPLDLAAYSTVPPTITFSSVSQNRKDFTLQCGVVDAASPTTIQWYVSTANDMTGSTAISGATSTFATTTISTANNYYFRLIVTSGDAKTATSQIYGPYAVIGGDMAGTWSIVRQVDTSTDFPDGFLNFALYDGVAHATSQTDASEWTIDPATLAAAATGKTLDASVIAGQGAVIDLDATHLLACDGTSNRRIWKLLKSDLSVVSYANVGTPAGAIYGLALINGTQFAATQNQNVTGNSVARVYNLSAVTGGGNMTQVSTATLGTGGICGNVAIFPAGGFLMADPVNSGLLYSLNAGMTAITATADISALIGAGIQFLIPAPTSNQFIACDGVIMYLLEYTPAPAPLVLSPALTLPGAGFSAGYD